MFVTQARSSPSARRKERRARRHARSEAEHRRRGNLILGGIGLVLFAVLIAGFIGMAVTIAPTDGPSAGYGTDGARYSRPPNWSIVWLAVVLMDAVAIMGYGIATAVRNQE